MSDALRPAETRLPRTSPDHEDTGWPRGIKYIVGNEGCERFSFYGMKIMLKVYLAILLVRESGMATAMAETQAEVIVHIWVAATYAMGLIGAVLAEKLLGKYRTILWLSIVYCGGHAALALFEGSLSGTALGLGLIAIGSGGIKPCVSAHVGDQFGRSNWFRMQRVFQIFYFMINFGSLFATLMIPSVRDKWGYSVAFAIPGILMGMATLLFWMGRRVFIHVPPRPGKALGGFDFAVGFCLAAALMISLLGWEFADKVHWAILYGIAGGMFVLGLALFGVRQGIERDNGFLAVIFASLGFGSDQPATTESSTRYRSHWFFGRAARIYGDDVVEGPVAVFRIVSVFLFVSIFWSLFDQHASTWLSQGGRMATPTFDIPLWGQWTLGPEQFSSLNPALVMILIPFLGFGLYPLLDRVGFAMTPLRRMSAGMLITGGSFLVAAIVERRIESAAAVGEQVSILWQAPQYIVLTLGEVLVSITGLEFAYTQAPRSMKSIIMGFFLLTVAIGNVFTALTLDAIQTWEVMNKFYLFACVMAVAGVLFSARAYFYQYKDYPQE